MIKLLLVMIMGRFAEQKKTIKQRKIIDNQPTNAALMRAVIL